MPDRTGLPANARVLLLGNDSTLERDIIAPLRSERCEVILAVDCRQALEIAHTCQVDVLVLDYGSYSRKFWQLASKFAFAERRSWTLVLADSLEQLTLASEAGADGVFMKPLDPNQIRAVIHNLLAGARTHPLAESWRSDSAPFAEAPPSRRDWEHSE